MSDRAEVTSPEAGLCFGIMVLGSPWSPQSVGSALRVAQAALAAGHRVLRVFFCHEGVQAASRLAVPAPPSPDYPQAWAELAERHGIDLVACAASAVRRGVLSDSEARRHHRGTASLAPGVELAGLAQRPGALLPCDRLLSFGPSLTPPLPRSPTAAALPMATARP